jgi:two-component system sensor kinase FixL
MKPNPPSSGTGSQDGAHDDEDARRDSETKSQTLHGQMLHVSRLATVGEMAAGIAHELNQPLAAITNYANACERLLGRPDADLTEVRDALRQISAEAIRAGDILRRLRTLARGHAVQRSPADINAVIREIAELLEGDARAHRARLILELTEPLPHVVIDVAQVQHVLLNLVRNGFEAIAPGGTAQPEVLIRTGSAETETIEVAVCDNGPGLTALALERLFDPFFSTKDEGTGLGLPISNTLIRAQGGTLGYRPNVPAGACFYFRLPVEAAGSA